MSARRRAAAAALAIALGGAVLSVRVVAAGADPIGSCSTRVGTVVAADFSHFGGPVVRGCGVGAATGFALLHAAGFVTTGDQHDGPAFVCRLGNAAFDSGTQLPTDDKCILTPPPNASWAFWVAPAGQHTWTYSPRGAMSDVPQPGEVELWTFNATDPGSSGGPTLPTFGPDAVRAQNTAPVTVPHTTPTTRATAAPTTAGRVGPSGAAVGPGPSPPVTASPTRSGPGGAGVLPGQSAGAHTPGTSVAPESSTTIAPTAAVGSAALSASTPRIVDAQPAPRHSAAAGSVLPVVIALALLAGLGAAAAAVSVRRRRAEA